jgi:molybdenum cofactor cytidylyltransferase
VTHLDLRLLNQKCAAADAAAATYDGVTGIPACFDARMLDELEELEGDRGARSLLRGDDFRVSPVPMDHAGVDIDTPDDLEELTSTDNRGSR